MQTGVQREDRPGTPRAGEKPAYVHRAFVAIANRYDLLNTLLSFNLDRGWRRATVAAVGLSGSEAILDVATGTGMLAREMQRRLGAGGKVLGIDFCEPMLRRAKGLADNIHPVLATAERLPFADSSLDGATVAFGLRNVPDMEMALREAARVVRPGGRVVCLEFSRPRNVVLRRLHRLYLFRVLPAVGWLISGDREAYLYLPRSIMAFPSAEELRSVMEKAGLEQTAYRFLTWGVVAIHSGTKPGPGRALPGAPK